jgi:hypothetical protein
MELWDTLDSVLSAFAVVLLLAALGGLVSILAGVHLGARVGDILVFKPGTRVAEDLTITATRYVPSPANPATCVLTPAVMVDGGGSLLVEQKSTAEDVYRVHWQGVHTSRGAEDCGKAVDLTLTRLDLQTLINALGGISLNGHGFVI